MITSAQSTLSFICLTVFRELSASNGKVSTERYFGKLWRIRASIPQLAKQKVSNTLSIYKVVSFFQPKASHRDEMVRELWGEEVCIGLSNIEFMY